MKTFHFRFGLLAAIVFPLLWVSCEKEIEAPENIALPQYTQYKFEAVSAPETKSVRNRDGSISWLPADEINIFCGDQISGRFISDNTEPADRTTFTGHFNTELSSDATFWAVYPYMSSNSFDGTGLTLSVPTSQVSSQGSFGPGMFPSVAKSNSNVLSFYNVCGGIKFSLSRNDIDLITLSSNGEEAIAGSVNVSFDSDGKPVSSVVDGSSEVSLRPSSGGCFESGSDYFITILPVTMSRGFTMTFHTNDGLEGTLISQKSVSIQRSVFSRKDNIDSIVTDWTETSTSSDFTDSGVYLGILGFNQALYTCPVALLTSDGALNSFNSFVDGLQMKNGTILYYAADNGLSNMQQIECPSNLTAASLITFTDGLDQGSMMMNPDYETEDKYLSAVSTRIQNGNVCGLPLSAYSIGIRGNDVQNVDKFRNNLAKLASSDQNSFELSNISELDNMFSNIADKVSVSVEYSHDISLTIPGLPDGTKVRITFDDVSNASSSNLYIEGTFNLRSRTLSGVTYYGLSSRSGSAIAGIEDGIFVKFNFAKVRRNDGAILSNTSVKQWQYVSSSSAWQVNSEFDNTADTDISVSVSRKSSIVYLVLDCSSSLGSDFNTMKQYVKNFIRKLYDNSYVETRVKSVRISANDVQIEKNETYKLSAFAMPVTALDRSLTWSSQNQNIASVDAEGNVFGVSAGSTNIYATSNDGGYRAYCYVTVVEDPGAVQEQPSYSQSGLYLGVMAFNQKLYRYPICRLTEETAERICSFIDNIPTRNGSLVYFAEDEAVSEIKAPNYPDNLYNAAIVSFTDCLDQGSLMKRSYLSNEEYLSVVHEKMMDSRVCSAPLTAYSIGIRGNDVSDVSGYKANLAKLATSEANAYEITDIDQLKGKLNSIADVVSVSHEYSYTYNLSVTIPGPGNATRVRFTFDNVNDAASSNLYIEGTFNLSDKSLSGLVYKGFSLNSGTKVYGSVSGIFVTFSFNGLKKADNSTLSCAYMKEWISDASQSVWQINSEFNNYNDVTTEVSTQIQRKSGVIYLVLDYSSSIKSDISTMKSAAKDFVRTLQSTSYDPYQVSGVSLDRSEIKLYTGRAATLVATVQPDTAEDKTVVWSTNNPSVAAVNQEGLVTAVAPGTAEIIAITRDGERKATCLVTVIEAPVLEAVDLGLPSGLKWASWNVGASAPEEYGDFFAWGETEPKTYYSWATYKLSNGSYNTLTRYCHAGKTDYWGGPGSPDGKMELKDYAYQDDAALANWGGGWRTPTDVEWTELREKCSWITNTQNGVTGELVTGPNGNSIFIPYAGCQKGTNINLERTCGTYWSSSLNTYTPDYANNVYFDSGSSGGCSRSSYRCYGLSVRAVAAVLSESISLTKTNLLIYVGYSKQLIATVLPDNTTRKSVFWSSDNTDVAVVDQDGKVKALNIGTAIITATTIDNAKTASCEVIVIETPKPEAAIDLGLPSGLKWATVNVGATVPEEYGDYFAWGETKPYYEILTLSSPVWKDGLRDGYGWNSYSLGNRGYNAQYLRKYCPADKTYYWSGSGAPDGKTEFKDYRYEDDAARANWGSIWRTPTDAEWTELRENCTCTWTSDYKGSGVAGVIITSKVSGYTGKSIFLPAAGRMVAISLNDAGAYGYYWSSLINTNDPFKAWDICFDSGYVSINYDYRFFGQPVRPVVYETIHPEWVSLSKSILSIYVGHSERLIATVFPDRVTDKSVTWSSSNMEIAKVDEGGNVYALKAGSAIISVTTTDCAKTAICEVTVIELPKNNDHEYVDFGLPSGLKWATCNVGAIKPEEYGDFFAWGETEPKTEYSWASYKWCNGSYKTLTRYCPSVRTNYWGGTGLPDDKTEFKDNGYDDDAARTNWGGSWRMPTDAEWKELLDNCTLEWTNNYCDIGVSGRIVRSKKPGYTNRSIFLPASGYWSDTDHIFAEYDGCYWSSTLNMDSPCNVWHLRFDSGILGGGYDIRETCRCFGYSVRPVSE